MAEVNKVTSDDEVLLGDLEETSRPATGANPEGQLALSGVDQLLAELLPDGDTGEPSSPDPEIGEEAITTARRRDLQTGGAPRRRPASHEGIADWGRPSDRALALGQRQALDAGKPGPPRTIDQPGPVTGSGGVLRLVGAFALASLVGIVAVLLLSTDEQTGVTTAPTPDPVEFDVDLAELQEILSIIGLEGLTAERDGSVVRITGTVASNDQLLMARDAASALSQDADLDTSGVVVDEFPSGVSESSSVVTTDRPKTTLQRDLDRLLTLTPIMFDPGRSELAELDKRILNAVAAVILSAPEAEVSVIGHADDGAEDGEAGTDLAAARALAVSDYLAAQGVRPDLLTPEERAEGIASDFLGAIEIDVAIEDTTP